MRQFPGWKTFPLRYMDTLLHETLTGMGDYQTSVVNGFKSAGLFPVNARQMMHREFQKLRNKFQEILEIV